MPRSPSSSAAAALGAVLAACGSAPAHLATTSCPADRMIVLASPADVTRIASCQVRPGVLVRTGAALDLSALRALTAITGDLVIGPTVGIEEVRLGALRRVDGALRVVSNGLLQGLYLPRLERAGDIDIAGNAAIKTISLPRLAQVRGALRITDNASLELVDVSALATIGRELVLARDPQLSLIEATQLQRAAAVQVDLPDLPPDITGRLRAAVAPP